MVRGRYLLTVLCCVFLTSCAPLGFFAAGTAAGIGGYKYYQGALNVIYQAPYIKTWDAALKVLEEMEFTIESKKHDPTTGKIVARRADEKPVTISFKYRSSEETEVMIRVGLFGDRNASMVIKEKIRNKLFK
jgi:hypothetical protein